MKIITVLILNIYSLVLVASPLDSIGIEKSGKKQYILHKVDSKETIYSIARRYGKSVKEIKAVNSGLQSSINIGQVLKVPFTGPEAFTSSGSKKHKVVSKETLYSVAKKYHVSVDQLKKSNPGISALKVGSILLIPDTKTMAKAAPGKTEPKKDEGIRNKSIESKPVKVKEEIISELKKEDETKPESKKVKKEQKQEQEQVSKGLAINVPAVAPTNASYKKTIESGFADVSENSNETLKYLAWHKTAPLGTIIQIENQDNHQKIFVRIIGRLAPTEKVLIKISTKAMERLDGKNSRIPVVLTYIP